MNQINGKFRNSESDLRNRMREIFSIGFGNVLGQLRGTYPSELTK